MKSTKVIHIKDSTGAADELYIGRAKGNLPTSIWHNPFVLGIHGNRDQVLRLYAEYLSRQTDLIERVNELKGKTLVCYCKPNACHGDILAALADSDNGITYGDITINKITNNMEDTMKSNPQYIEITFTTDITNSDGSILGKHVVNWLRTDLNVLRPMRFVGLVVEQNAAHLNTDVAFISKATFSVEEPLSKPELVASWVQNTVNQNTTAYSIQVTNVVIDPDTITMPELVATEVIVDGNTGALKEATLVPKEDTLNTEEQCPECNAPISKMHATKCPRHPDNYDEHINNQSEEDTPMQFQFPDADNDVKTNNKNPNPSEEDTNMSIEKPQFTLPNDDDEFRISWRLDANSDWEPEVTRPTLNQAMHYIADAANQLGEFKIEQLVGNEVILINLNRTTQPKIHEYKLWLYDQEVQVTTNSMPEGEALAYKTYNDELNAGKQEVIAFKHQAEITAKWVLDTQHKVTKGIRVKPQFVSETWQYALIMQRIVRLGGFFRFVRIGKDELKMIDEQVINRMIENSSFAFAEGEDLTIFTVADHNYQQVAWDDFEDFIGIKIINSPKMGKRMKEITRYTLYWDTMTKPLVIHPVEFESDMEIAVDGIGAISASAFKRMIENIPIEAVRRGSYGKLANGGIRRVNFRYVYGDGLIKGDAIVVPDSVLEAQYGYVPDLVQPVVNGELINLKKELRTDGSWAIMTANPHHAHHQPMTNDQVLSIMSNHADEPWLFSEEQLKEDHLSFINDVHEDLKNGIFPKFMTAEGMFDSSNDKKDNDLLAARLQQLSVRWNMAGRSLLESAFFIRMVGNGFLNRLNKALGKKGDGEGKPGKKKIMVPIRHAAYVHVTTLSIIEMCGYDPAEEGWDTTKCFYYEPAHSWVKPDSVFIHDFARHGGEDGDDSEIVMIRNVQFPDGSVKVMAISVRMPTAWGEWSMNEVDTNGFPFYNTWNEMPTVIYADRPEFLEEMNQLVSGLPVSDVEMPAEYTAQWCMFLVELIKLNPGVGRIINPMIAYYATMHTYFPEQLASTEDFVDTLQQTPDKDAFVAINGEIERMLQLIVDSGAVIDDHIYKTRLQSVELPKDSDTTTSTDGFFTRMFRFTAACAADWEQKVRELATNRTEIPRLNELVLPETIEMVWFDGKNIVDSPMAAARFLIRNFDSDYKRYKYIPKGEARRQFSGNLTNNIVDWIMNQPEQSRHWIMVAVYQYIWKTKDRKDNFLFQTPLNAWDKSTMDVLLITLYHLGLAKIQLADGSWHYKEELKGESITEATDADLAGMVEEEGEY